MLLKQILAFYLLLLGPLFFKFDRFPSSRMAQLVSNEQLKLLPIIASALAVATIVTCYVLATSAGHTPAFPNTDITHCALKAPERYIFRIGMIPTCVILATVWYFIFWWVTGIENCSQLSALKAKRGCCTTLEGASFRLGVVGSLCLLVASSVLESHNTVWSVHVAGATSFFILTILAQVLVTVKLCHLNREIPGVCAYSSLAAKIIICTLAVLLLIADLAFGIFKLPSSYSNAAEWILVLFILSFNFTLYDDWKKSMFGVATTLPDTHIASASHQLSTYLAVQTVSRGNRLR